MQRSVQSSPRLKDTPYLEQCAWNIEVGHGGSGNNLVDGFVSQRELLGTGGNAQPAQASGLPSRPQACFVRKVDAN